MLTLESQSDTAFRQQHEKLRGFRFYVTRRVFLTVDDQVGLLNAPYGDENMLFSSPPPQTGTLPLLITH